MLIFSRRFKSSLVKAQASNALNNIIEEKKQYYEMADYETANLKEYFEQNGLMFPVETIIEKYRAEDYDFFLSKGNFLKVVDTLEKFGSNLDTDHEGAKDFILFKKKLYKLFEVRGRSASEHAEFSSKIYEDELVHVYDAHRHHLATIAVDNHISKVSNQINLKGAFYKRKLLSPSRVKGLAGSFVTLSFVLKGPYLWPYFAWNSLVAKLYYATPIASTLYTIYNFSENNIIHSIERIDSGSDEGKVRISVADSPFITHDIIAEPNHIIDGGNVGENGISALKVTQGFDVKLNKEFNEERLFSIDTSSDGNAWINHEGMDWLLQSKDTSSETDSLYADLVHQRAKDLSTAKRERKDFLQELRYAIEQ